MIKHYFWLNHLLVYFKFKCNMNLYPIFILKITVLFNSKIHMKLIEDFNQLTSLNYEEIVNLFTINMDFA